MKALTLLILLTTGNVASAAEYKLTWAVGTMLPNGPHVANVQELKKFKGEDECTKFGTDHSPRMQDWVRGRINADWDHAVAIKFKCELDGQGA